MIIRGIGVISWRFTLRTAGNVWVILWTRKWFWIN